MDKFLKKYSISYLNTAFVAFSSLLSIQNCVNEAETKKQKPVYRSWGVILHIKPFVAPEEVKLLLLLFGGVLRKFENEKHLWEVKGDETSNHFL